MKSVFGVLMFVAMGAALWVGSVGCSSSTNSCETDGFGGSSSGGSSSGCTSSGSSGGSSSGGTAACGVDLKTATCASCVQSSCCSVTQTCANDSSCASAVNCIAGCSGDSTCENNCVTSASSAAQSELTAMATCWSNSCSGPCGSGGSSGSSSGGTSSSSSGGNSTCANPGGACTTTTQCCQTGSGIPEGAVCVTNDGSCHALCDTSSQCASGCCVQLQTAVNGHAGNCGTQAAGTTCL